MADYREHVGLLNHALGGSLLVLMGQCEWIWQQALAGDEGPGDASRRVALADSCAANITQRSNFILA